MATPTDLARVKAQLSIADDDTRNDAQLTVVVNAVNGYVPTLPYPASVAPDGADPWPDAVSLGATMLGARLARRRNSPSGVEPMGTAGVAYVARTDPDIAMLLRTGTQATPRVG